MSKKHAFWHKDSANLPAPEALVNKTFFHPKTQSLYHTSGISFDAERGRWMINYHPVHRNDGDDFEYSHLPEDFTRVVDGQPRFIEVKK